LLGQQDPIRTHSIFEDFFGIKPFEFPLEQEIFEPAVLRRWSRMLDRLMDEELDFEQLSSGETFRENSVYTRDNGIETRKNVRTRISIQNGIPTETKIEEYIYPNGDRDVTKTVVVNGKAEKNSYHLKKGEETPKELTF
jgi:hypothetical protein